MMDASVILTTNIFISDYTVVKYNIVDMKHLLINEKKNVFSKYLLTNLNTFKLFILIDRYFI